jgi:GNAT superfamily N-acetyltransferase
MPTLRRAAAADAALITQHRHRMFAANSLAPEARYAEMDAAFLPWVTERLVDGRYVGIFLQEGDAADATVLAACGIFYMDFPPHYLDPAPIRAYLLNFYTAPESRGLGYANRLLEAAVDDCRDRNVAVVTLHASQFGRPIYERFGFAQHNEMVLRLDPDPTLTIPGVKLTGISGE